MKFIILTIFLSLISNHALSDMKCYRELSLSQAEVGVKKFIKITNLPDYKDKFVKLKKDDKTCHYVYFYDQKLAPGENSPLHSGQSLILNDRGDVVMSNLPPSINTGCTNLNLKKDDLIIKLKELRAIHDLPNEPKEYKIYMAPYLNCSYVYIEHKITVRDNALIISPEYRINTFYFDYNGELYAYYESI